MNNIKVLVVKNSIVFARLSVYWGLCTIPSWALMSLCNASVCFYLISDGDGVLWCCHECWQPWNKHLSLETVLWGKWGAHTVCSSRSCATTKGKMWQVCLHIIAIFSFFIFFSITPRWSSTTLTLPWWWRPGRSTASSPSWCHVWAADGVLSASSLIWLNLVTQRWSPSLWKPPTCSLSPKAVYQMSRSFTPSSTSMGETQTDITAKLM